jgi:uncharacterized RmlC-like cupin family protein
MKYIVEMVSSDMIYIPNFMMNLFRHSSNIKLIAVTIWDAAVLLLLTGGIYEYAVEVISGGMMYIPSFIKIRSGIEKLLGRIHIDTQTAKWSHKPSFVFK